MSDVETVQLVATTEVLSAEILVLDSRFQFVARAVGILDARLAPGAYTVQYKAGSAVVDVPVILRPGAGVVRVTSPPLTMKSPAPLAGNDAGSRYGEFARACSREIHERKGTGGELFVFMRSAAPDVSRVANADRLAEVSILDAYANVIADLSRSGKRSDDRTSLGCNLELASGTYLLRFRAGDLGLLEQSVVISEGWQTQVFASSRAFGDPSGAIGPNFPEAAVFMARQGLGFEPSGPAAARTEAARQGLAENRLVAPERRLREVVDDVKNLRQAMPDESQIEGMLRQKFGNPMFGIYGVHLMLLNPERPWDLLREMVATLKTLVGSHPDVMALTMLPELHDLGEGIVYTLPPMLRNSWKLVVDNSTTHPEVVPPSSYAASIAPRTWGSNAWLVWRPLPAPTRAMQAADKPGEAVPLKDVGTAIAQLQKHILENIRALGVGPYVQKVAEDQRLTDTERAILMYSITAAYQGAQFLAEMRSHSSSADRVAGYLIDKLKQRSWTDWLTGGLKLAPVIVAHFASDRLVQALGVPLASLNQAIVSLNDKLARDSL